MRRGLEVSRIVLGVIHEPRRGGGVTAGGPGQLKAETGAEWKNNGWRMEVTVKAR